MKICGNCGVEKDEKDFLRSENCYKCEYAKRLRTFEKLNLKKCAICSEELDKGRSVYCSDECAHEGKDRHNKAYWTNRIRDVNGLAQKKLHKNLDFKSLNHNGNW